MKTPSIAKFLLFAGAVIATVELASLPVTAATYYVSTTGNDSTGDGSVGNPFATIGHADGAGLLNPGDVVVVAPGTYTTGVLIQTDSGATNSPIVYETNGSGSVVIDQSAVTPPSYGFQITSSCIVVNGFEIKGATEGVSVQNASSCVISNCLIHDSAASTDCAGIQLLTATDVILYGNVIYNINATGNTPWSLVGAAVEVSAGNNIDVWNNTIDNCYLGVFYYGSSRGSAGPYAEISTENNIVANCAGWGFVNPWDTVPTTFVSGYNLVFNDATTYGNYPAGNNGPLATDVGNKNPQFVNEATHDYHLLSNSPGINAGNPLGFPYLGPAPEIGAFEFPNTMPPTLVSAKRDPVTTTLVTVAYNEPIDPTSATKATNYTINHGVTVSSVAISNLTTVILTTTAITSGPAYTLTVNNVMDASGNLIASNSQVIISIPTSGASTYYVNGTTGSDSNPGTSSLPWKTIGNGDVKGLVAPGDTVIVQAGTYAQATGQGLVLATTPGTASSPIVYQASGSVIIDQTAFVAPSYGIQIREDGITINGFEIKGASYGVLVDGTGSFTGGDTLIENCVIHDSNPSDSSGVFVDQGFGTNTVEQNVIYNINAAGNGPWGPVGCGVRDSDAANLVVVNNTIDNCYLGVFYYGAGEGGGPYGFITTLNNIVVNSKGWAFVNPWSTAAGTFLSDFNLLYNDAVTYGNYPAGNNGPTANDVSGESPDFVFEADHEYGLLADSPAVGAGTNVGLPFSGAAPNIGAFQGTNAPAAVATISGIVTANVAGNPPIPGATVKTTDGAYVTTTAADGTYSFVVGPGTDTVEAIANGFTTEELSTNTSPGGAAMLNFSLTIANAPKTYYVDTTGNDSNPGTSGQPWATIGNGDATGVLNPGDTVIVAAGTYVQATANGVSLTNKSGYNFAPITYTANGSVVIDQSGFSGSSYGFNIAEPGLVINGFEVKGAAHGIYLAPGSSYCVVSSNLVHDANAFGQNADGIFVNQSANVTVERNVIYNVTATNDTPWSPVGSGIRDSDSANLVIINNTIDNAYLGIFFYGASLGAGPYGHVTTENNIVVNCAGWGFVNPWSTDPTLFTSGYNLVYSNMTDFGNYPANNNAALPTDIGDQNPLFVNEASHNYQLQTNSPAFNKGTYVGLAFIGPAPDIGAFESSYVPAVHTYYVNGTTGNDSNPGTLAQPWLSINNGDQLGILNAGDTVMVASGTYAPADMSGIQLTNRGGTLYEAINYVAQGSVVIDDTSFGTSAQSYGFYVGVNGISIQGFEIIGAEHGVYLAPGFGGSTVDSCLIHDGAWAGQNAEGVFADHCINCTISRNIMYNILDIGSDTPWSPVGCGVRDGESPGLKVLNNTIDNCYLGVYFYGNAPGGGPYAHITTENNIVTDCAGWALVNPWDGAATDFTSGYNLVYNNGTGWGNYPAGNNGPELGDVTTDPMFVDEAGANYNLETNSPAIAAGINVGLPFSGPAPTIGAIQPAIAAPLQAAISGQGSNLVITWQGSATLQSAPSIGGPWSDINSATSPYPVTNTGAQSQMFFRLKQ